MRLPRTFRFICDMLKAKLSPILIGALLYQVIFLGFFQRTEVMGQTAISKSRETRKIRRVAEVSLFIWSRDLQRHGTSRILGRGWEAKTLLKFTAQRHRPSEKLRSMFNVMKCLASPHTLSPYQQSSRTVTVGCSLTSHKVQTVSARETVRERQTNRETRGH